MSRYLVRPFSLEVSGKGGRLLHRSVSVSDVSLSEDSVKCTSLSLTRRVTSAFLLLVEPMIHCGCFNVHKGVVK